MKIGSSRQGGKTVTSPSEEGRRIDCRNGQDCGGGREWGWHNRRCQHGVLSPLLSDRFWRDECIQINLLFISSKTNDGWLCCHDNLRQCFDANIEVPSSRNFRILHSANWGRGVTSNVMNLHTGYSQNFGLSARLAAFQSVIERYFHKKSPAFSIIFLPLILRARTFTLLHKLFYIFVMYLPKMPLRR